MMIKGLGAGVLAIAMMFGINSYESSYTRDAEVLYIEDGIATFEDTCGFTWDWEVETGDNLYVGKQVVLHMDSMHTDTITDDVIKEVE